MGNWHPFHHFGRVSTSDRMLYFNNDKRMCTMWTGKARSRHVSQRIAAKHQEQSACAMLYSDCSWYDIVTMQDIICTMRSVTSNMNNVICTEHQHTEQLDMLMKIPSAFHTRQDAVVGVRYCIIRVYSSETGHIIPQVKGQQQDFAYHTAEYAFL